MKLDFTPVYLAFGISLATYLLLRLRKVTPDVRFKEIKYDRIRNEMHLVIENISNKFVYVKPALRLVKLTPASEWRERTANGNSPVPLMAASAGSVIKGYELIGEYAEPVGVKPKETAVIKYPVMRDFRLKAYDNIKVDSPVGYDPEEMEGSVTWTVQMGLSELLSDCSDELLEALDEYLKSGDGKSVPGAGTGVVLPEPEIRKSDFPVQAMCFCCGKDRWLNWVVDRNHVCDGCKEFLGEGKKQPEVTEISDPADDEHLDFDEPNLEFELVKTPQVHLKPRHKRILDTLYGENTLSTKELSKKLERDEKAVATDLRFLLRNNLVDRVKINGRYKYFSLRDQEQIVIYDPTNNEPPQQEWT